MREFDLDLLIGKEVVVNCKTEQEAEEFLKYLDSKKYMWLSGNCIDNPNSYGYFEFIDKTCFSLRDDKKVTYSSFKWYIDHNYKILSLDDLVIKPKNNFKDYGFEADFEGEILKEVDGVYLGYVIDSGYLEMLKIYKSGSAYGNGTKGKYNLKPIKKEWYENPDNFPCVVYHIYDNSFHIATDTTINEDSRLIKIYDKYRPCDVFRPATKEEVLSLLVKE